MNQRRSPYYEPLCTLAQHPTYNDVHLIPVDEPETGVRRAICGRYSLASTWKAVAPITLETEIDTLPRNCGLCFEQPHRIRPDFPDGASIEAKLRIWAESFDWPGIDRDFALTSLAAVKERTRQRLQEILDLIQHGDPQRPREPIDILAEVSLAIERFMRNPELATASATTGEPPADAHPIVAGEDGGGFRDFLGGEPIRCGSLIDKWNRATGDWQPGRYELTYRTRQAWFYTGDANGSPLVLEINRETDRFRWAVGTGD